MFVIVIWKYLIHGFQASQCLNFLHNIIKSQQRRVYTWGFCGNIGMSRYVVVSGFPVVGHLPEVPGREAPLCSSQPSLASGHPTRTQTGPGHPETRPNSPVSMSSYEALESKPIYRNGDPHRKCPLIVGNLTERKPNMGPLPSSPSVFILTF